MELDVARMVADEVGSILESRLDSICREVVNLFKQDKLSQMRLVELFADYKATGKLMRELQAKAK